MFEIASRVLTFRFKASFKNLAIKLRGGRESQPPVYGIY